MTQADRNRPTSVKYVQTGTVTQRPEFSGDNRDQRSFFLWCDLWMGACLHLVKPGGVLASFIDWRQLSALVDALQVAGWIYRGIVVWDKTEGCRPQKGWFRSQAEFVVLGSAGPLHLDRSGPAAPGVFRHASTGSKKLHIAGKPLPLITGILSGGKYARLLDPFMGSGTTLCAAKSLGIKSVGIEIEERYCEIAATRLQREVGS